LYTWNPPVSGVPGYYVLSLSTIATNTPYIFSGTNTNHSVTGLTNGEEYAGNIVAANVDGLTGLYNRINSLQKDVNEKEKVFNERKAEMINNTAIPNTKEDLIDFLVLCSTQANVAFANRGYSKVISAWSRKGNEAVSKAKILFKNNIESMALVDKFEKKLKFGKLLSYLTVRNIIILLIIIRLIWMNLF
jgi:hypothetical protein